MNYKMKLYRQNNILLLTISCLLLISCSQKTEDKLGSRVASLPYYQEASFTPYWFEKGTTAQKTFHQIPAFRFTNQEGKTITEATFKDKIYITDFFFTTCPGICPKMTANMDILQQEFKDDDEVLLLSHSVTPVMDSVPVLKEYALRKGVIDGKWNVTTGSKKHIYELARKSYFAVIDEGNGDENDWIHTEQFVLVDKDRRIRGYYDGTEKKDMKKVIADIALLKEEYNRK